MKILGFRHPVFISAPNVNLTVRRGVKWAAQKGNEVEVRETTRGKVFGTATITATRVVKFDDLTDADLHCNHDPECRTVAGLFDRMRRAYAGAGSHTETYLFDKKEIVTLVFFEINFCTQCGHALE